MAAGAGIAGVASKSEAAGIKLYKDHSKYKEWEFIYDRDRRSWARREYKPSLEPRCPGW